MPLALLHSLWRYRGFVLSSVRRELLSRYHRSLFGAAWVILNPIVMITIYTIIFSEIMKTRLPEMGGKYVYSIYLCAGLFAWNHFSEIVNKTLTVFIDNQNLIKKVNFPKACLPLVIVLTESVNLGIVLLLFTVLLASINEFPGIVLLTLAPVFMIQTILAVGLGIFLGTLNVFFRDVGHIAKVALQFWFWLTPIVYPLSIVPERIRPILELNPILPLIEAYQRVFVTNQPPAWNSLLPSIAVAFVFLWLGWRTFKKNSSDVIDEL